jgi:4-hydroxy-tetrahydrodipicolinate reductase
MNPIRVCIAGAGRMGQAVAGLVEEADDLTLVAVWKRGDDIDALAGSCDVVVDFSLPDATSQVISAATRHKKPLVCGVSGLSDQQMAALDEAAHSIAVVYDRNMSTGVAVLENLARQAAAALGADFAVEVHETHHVHKVDAPSGTALKLGAAIAAERGTDPGEIHYESERRGEVPGDHTVILSSATERLSLGHSVTTRQVFAEGAVKAARWIVNQPPGRFTMHDVLE